MSDCKSVENLGSEIMEKLNEKNKLKRSGSNYSKVKFDRSWYIGTISFFPGTLVFSHRKS